MLQTGHVGAAAVKITNSDISNGYLALKKSILNGVQEGKVRTSQLYVRTNRANAWEM